MSVPQDEITALAKKWQADRSNKNAELVIVAMNDLCWWHINRHRRKTNDTSISDQDLLQEARIGIMHALEKYDGERCFVTYASWWIMSGITRHIRDFSDDIRYPGGQKWQSIAWMYLRLYRKFESEDMSATPGDIHKKIAVELNVPINDVNSYACRLSGCVRIDAIPVDTDFKTGIENILCDHTDEYDPVEIDIKRIKKIIDSASFCLPPLHRAVIKWRLLGGQTLVFVGDRMGVSRQRVEQVEKEVKPILISWIKSALGDECEGDE